jgi:hypothetical protein
VTLAQPSQAANQRFQRNGDGCEQDRCSRLMAKLWSENFDGFVSFCPPDSERSLSAFDENHHHGILKPECLFVI